MRCVGEVCGWSVSVRMLCMLCSMTVVDHAGIEDTTTHTIHTQHNIPKTRTLPRLQKSVVEC